MNAVTGEILPVSAFMDTGKNTTFSLEFDRFDSWFIVFRNPVPGDNAGKTKLNFPKLIELTTLSDLWKVTFDPTWGGPGETEFPKLINWINSTDDGIKYYSGKATYRKAFDLIPKAKEEIMAEQKGERLFLDLGNVKNVAEVRLNGRNLGTLWCAPWRVEITSSVKPTGNTLEIDIINLWANRVVGDLNLPKDKRYTKIRAFRFDMLKSDTPLLESIARTG